MKIFKFPRTFLKLAEKFYRLYSKQKKKNELILFLWEIFKFLTKTVGLQ